VLQISTTNLCSVSSTRERFINKFTPAGVVNCVDISVVIDAVCSTGLVVAILNEFTRIFHSMYRLNLNIHVLATSVVDAVHNGALVVVGVIDAVIGIATPI
jgi:hypothetical protein